MHAFCIHRHLFVSPRFRAARDVSEVREKPRGSGAQVQDGLQTLPPHEHLLPGAEPHSDLKKKGEGGGVSIKYPHFAMSPILYGRAVDK